ncbi:MAG: endo-1,4-beta-xylanase [Bacteroidota bacterium]
MNFQPITILTFLFLSTAAFTQNDAYHENFLNQLQTEYSLMGGDWIFTSNEEDNIDRAGSYGSTKRTIEVNGQDFMKAVNLDIPETGENPWNAGYSISNVNTIRRGDKVIAVIWLRTVSTPLGGIAGRVNIFLEDVATFDKEFILTASPSGQWQQYLIPFESTDTYPSGDLNFGLHLAYQQQVIEVAGMTAINYGNSVSLEDLPQNLNIDNYPGADADAPWRITAADRIEQHRKANMTLRIQDGNGNPIPNTDVRIEMLRHQYAFGTAVNPRRLANNSQANPIYMDRLINLDGKGHGFNWVVTENALKWRAWEQGWAGTQDETVKGIQWLVNNDIKVRGHVLVWPRWESMPPDMEENRNNPDYLTNRINTHLDNILNYEGVRDFVQEWDVINEIAHERDLENTLRGTAGYTTGREIYPQIIQKILEEDPSIITYLNDYAVLSNGSVEGGDYQLYKSMIQEVVDAGVQLDGIGFQAHMGSSLVAPDSLYAILEDTYQAFGKTIKITEYDQSDLLSEEIQAQYTGDFLKMIFSHPATDGFLMWGFWDAIHWRGNSPLYDDNWNPKPAHATFTDLVFNQWWTDTTLTTANNGVVDLRAFKGDYQITVMRNGQEITAELSLEDDVDKAIVLLPVSTKRILDEAEVKVYPTVVEHYLTLELPYREDWKITIFDSTGKLVSDHTSTDFIQFLDMESYPSGSYIVNISNQEGSSVSRKVIKK